MPSVQRLGSYTNIRSYSIRMDTFLGSEEQRVDAFAVVVRALVLGAPASDVERFSEPVCPFASVGFAAEVEHHQVEQLGEALAVGERADAVADPTVDLAQNLLDRAGGDRTERCSRESLVLAACIAAID